jgi:hypothetical protein
MNVLEFVVLVWLGIVALTVGIDAGLQLWVDKRLEREAHWAKVREAEAVLYAVIAKRFEERLRIPANVVELKVVAAPQKPVGGRHRLTAA